MKTKTMVSGFRTGDYVRHIENHNIRGTVLNYSHDSLLTYVLMDCGVTLIWDSSSFMLLDRPQSVQELIEESIKIADKMDRPWWKRLLRIS